MSKLKVMFFLCLVLVTGCHDQVKKGNIFMPSNIAVHLGERGDSFAKRIPDQVRIDRQPAGLDFYRIDWKTSAPGTVLFEHGKHSFTIENALDVGGYEDKDYPQEGMPELTVTAEFSTANQISHDEARIKMLALLETISQAGWSMFIDRGDPRLRGKDVFNYVLTTSPYSSLDASFSPSLKEWMEINSGMTWRFYANRVYLEVNFTREPTLTDPLKPGAYIVNFKIQNEQEHYREYVGPDNRKKWKELLPQQLVKLEKMRSEAEAKMRALNLKIDEAYQDPPVPALK